MIITTYAAKKIIEREYENIWNAPFGGRGDSFRFTNPVINS
jgi:hypothetical protein